MNDSGKRIFILSVKPLENHILQVEFVSGSFVLLDMKSWLNSVRFGTLRDPEVWKSATTNGLFVRFGHAELSHDEIIAMLESPPDCA